MKHILIPTDFSKNAWNAVRYTEQLFKNLKCSFYLLHVDEPRDPSIHMGEGEPNGKGNGIIEEFVLCPKKRMKNVLQCIEKSFSNENHTFYGVHDHGYFLESIKKHVGEKKIDIIAMGTKGSTGLPNRIIGSNTRNVLTKVQCNALIIPDKVNFETPTEIAFPTDFNLFYSHKVLDAMTSMVQLVNGHIKVMNVSKMDRHLTKVQEMYQEYLFDYLHETFPKSSSFHTVTNKNVNCAIQSFVKSQGIDLIVMVAKNLNFIQQILFDSRIDRINFHSKVPILVIH